MPPLDWQSCQSRSHRREGEREGGRHYRKPECMVAMEARLGQGLAQPEALEGSLYQPDGGR